MTAIHNLMTESHRHCDDFFADAELAVGKKDITLAKSCFEHFRLAMVAHFDAEEKTLFPTFEAKTGMSMGPTQVMRMEHTQIRTLMDEALESLIRNKPDDYLGHADTLVIMMQQHNMKEENMLYPMCDQHLSGETPELLTRLKIELAVS